MISETVQSQAKMHAVASSTSKGRGKGKNETKKNKRLQCAVCNARARGRNFGAITCESCKSFYRRHVGRLSWTCPDAQSCVINEVTRKYCPACRMAKCFEAGMRKPCSNSKSTFEIPTTLHEISLSLSAKQNQEKKASHSVASASTSTSIAYSDVFSADAKTNQEFSDFYTVVAANASEMTVNWQRDESTGELKSRKIDTFEQCTIDRLIGYIEFWIRRLLSFLKQVPAFRSVSPDLQQLIMSKNLLPQMFFLGAFCLDSDLSGWLVTETDGRVGIMRLSEHVSLFASIGLHMDDCFRVLTSFVHNLRSEFAHDWPIAVLFISCIDLFTVRDQVSRGIGMQESQRAALDERRNQCTEWLRTYLDRRYGDLSVRKLAFCKRVVDIDQPILCLWLVQSFDRLISISSEIRSARISARSNQLSTIFAEVQQNGNVWNYLATKLAPLLFELLAELNG